mgnify:CR=1 FL=1
MELNWQVGTFGRDCLGNISGYRVFRYEGQSLVAPYWESGDIYEPGSFERAKANCEAVCERMNSGVLS